MHCGIVDTVGRIKKIVQEEYLWTPSSKHLKMRLVRSGSLLPDDTPLCDILGKQSVNSSQIYIDTKIDSNQIDKSMELTITSNLSCFYRKKKGPFAVKGVSI